MSDIKKDTRKCKLRMAVKFGGSKRTTYCCRKRYGFMIKHWKCVGLGNKLCPLYETYNSQKAVSP